jgi:hypothetical protein
VRDNLETLHDAVDEGALPIALPPFVRKACCTDSASPSGELSHLCSRFRSGRMKATTFAGKERYVLSAPLLAAETAFR